MFQNYFEPVELVLNGTDIAIDCHSCMQKPLQKRRRPLINNIKQKEGSKEKALLKIAQQEQFCHPDQEGRTKVFNMSKELES